MRKSYKRLLFLFISLVFVALSGVVGYMLALNEPRIVDSQPSPTAVQVGADDARIAKGAAVTWTYEYDMCRHETTQTFTADNDLVGLSFSQLQQKYPEARIISFDPNEVSLEERFDCYCPDHYILKNDGGTLCVFQTKVNTGEQEKAETLDVSVDDMAEDEREALDTGWAFTSMDDVDAYIDSHRKQAE